MPQTSYNVDRSAAVAGLVVDMRRKAGKWVAGEEIPAGRACELYDASGEAKLRLYRGGKFAGFAMYRSMREPGAWAAGDYVPLLQEGEIWAAFDGESDNVTESAALASANLHGSSSSATDRGKVTDSAPTSAAGNEIYGGGSAVKFYGAASADEGLVLVSVNVQCDGLDALPKIVPLAQDTNDYAVPAGHPSGTIFEIGTSAGASTVSLPNSYADGTILYFFADGTKNGHALTFRDVTTAISGATAASTRILAVATRVGGKWAVNVDTPHPE